MSSFVLSVIFYVCSFVRTVDHTSHAPTTSGPVGLSLSSSVDWVGHQSLSKDLIRFDSVLDFLLGLLPLVSIINNTKIMISS